MLRSLSAAFLVAAFTSLASADPGPTLLTMFPPGVKAGETVEVTLTGTGFDGEEKLLFSKPGLKGELVAGSAAAPKMPNPQPGQRSTSVKFKVTAAKDVAGLTDVRLVCKSGLTNPRAFAVGTMTDLNESEPNNETSQAQKVELNTTINGTISANTDVDYYSVNVKSGQNVVVYCLTTSIDSRMVAELMVVAPDGKPIASNHGYRDGEAVLDFKAPENGDYLIRVSQFAYTTGGNDHFYRLTISDQGWTDAHYPPLFPSPDATEYGRNLSGKEKGVFVRPDGRPYDVAKISFAPSKTANGNHLDIGRSLPPFAGMLDLVDAKSSLLLIKQNPVVLDNEKNHTTDTAQLVTVPCDIAGRIEKKGARHWYSLEAKKGDVWTIEVFAERIGSPVDAFFVLSDEKGKTIVEQDDGADTLSPNQLYTKSDDPGRYKFTVPADGKYRVMVSTREAAVQFGVRDQYVLRIAKEKPEFRLAVMPVGSHYLDAGTLPKGGSAVFNVYVWRFDGFDGAIELSGDKLPKGITCLPQVISPAQTRGTLVLTAAKDAEDFAGFVSIKGTATTAEGQKLESYARPFSIVWPFPGVNAGMQSPNSPMITRLDRGPGLAVAIRGEAPFALTSEPVKTSAGAKPEITLKVVRSKDFKDAIQIYSASPNFGPRQQGGQPPAPIASIPADKNEVKFTLDLPQNITSGTHTLVFRGVAGAAAPKGGNNQQRLPISYATPPIALEVESKTTPKKK